MRARGARAGCASARASASACAREWASQRTSVNRSERASRRVCVRVFLRQCQSTQVLKDRGGGGRSGQQMEQVVFIPSFAIFKSVFQYSVKCALLSLIAVRKVCLHLQQQRCLAWVESQHATTIFPSHFISFPEGQRVSWRAANLRQWRHSCRQSLILDLTTWLLVSWLWQKQARRHVNPIQQACGEASVKFGRLR